MVSLPQPIRFTWDEGNQEKNLRKHGVSIQGIEETFFDPAKKLLAGKLHSGGEARYVLLGKTKRGRVLFVVFTIRGENIRAISARDLNRKERPLYEEAAEIAKI